MAKKNELNDINELLSGLGDDLTSDQPSQAQTPQKPPSAPKQADSDSLTPKSQPAPATQPDKGMEARIDDLLADLDKNFNFDSGSPAPAPSGAQKGPAVPPPQPAPTPMEKEEIRAPVLDDSGLDEIPMGPSADELEPKQPAEAPESAPDFEPPFADTSIPAEPKAAPGAPGAPGAPEETPSLDDIGGIEPEAQKQEKAQTSDLDLGGFDFDKELQAEMAKPPASKKVPAGAPEITTFPDEEPGETKKEKQAIKLTDQQMQFIQKRIEHFGPDLQAAVKSIILQDALPQGDVNELLNLILHKKPVKKIAQFVSTKLKRTINPPLLDPAYAELIRQKKGIRHGAPIRPGVRRLRPRGARKHRDGLSEWESSVLPSIQPLLIILAVLTVLVIVFYPPIVSHWKINKGLEQIATHESQNFIEAEKNFNSALRINPRYFDAYLIYARAYADIHVYQRAYDKLKDYYNLKKGDYNYYMALGDLEKKQDLLDEAERNYGEALKLNNKKFDAVDALALVKFHRGDIETSQKIYEDYVKNNAKNIVAQYRLLQIFLKQEDQKNIEKKYTEILRLKNRKILPDVLTSLGRFYVNLAKKTPEITVSDRLEKEKYLARAYAVLKKVREKAPTYADGYYQLARLMTETYDLVRATTALDYAIKYNGSRPEYYTLQGVIYRQRKDLGKAIENLQKAVEADDSYIPAHFQLARISFYDQTNFSTALKQYQQVKEMLSDSTPEDQSVEIDFNELNYNLGFLRYRIDNDYEGALQAWHDFAVEYPDNPAYLFASGNAYYHLGRYDIAKQNYEAAVSVYRSKLSRKPFINPHKKYDRDVYYLLSYSYNNMGICEHMLGDDGKALADLWQSTEAIKTISYFKDNTEATVNRQFLLHPPYRNIDHMLKINDNLPRDYNLPPE